MSASNDLCRPKCDMAHTGTPELLDGKTWPCMLAFDEMSVSKTSKGPPWATLGLHRQALRSSSLFGS